MTNEQALEILNGDFTKVVLQENESHSEVFAKAYNMAKKALEKQIPKKPKDYEDKFMHCPMCDEFLAYKWLNYPTELNHPMFSEIKNCWECGQAIDWSE